MRKRRTYPEAPALEQTLAVFGNARLVKKLDGKLEIRGGSECERSEAQRWVEMFLKAPKAGCKTDMHAGSH